MQKKKKEEQDGQNKQQEEGDGGNNFDKILKENIESVFLPLTEKYFNFKIVSSTVLEAKLQSTTEREVDFLRLVKTDKGKEFILHLEFQTENEYDMAYRIKEYDAIIQRKHKKEDKGKKRGKYKRLDIRHYVIFLGKGKMTMETQLPKQHVFSQFEALILNELDFDKMLQSQIPEEIILAILSNFKGKDPEAVIRLIVEKLKKCSNSVSNLKKFIRQLKVLSKLRTLEKETTKTINDMPIKYNLEEDYSYKQGIKKGMQLGEKRGMEKGIERGEKLGIERGEKLGMERGEKLGMERGEKLGIEKGEKLGMEKAITVMLMLGNNPEDIAKYLEVSIAWVMEIQQKLN